jgi:serine/threonine-protein kinase
MRPAPGPGDRVGPYQLEVELGHGGMGRVFRARDSRLGRVVAIKLIRPEYAGDEQFRRRFEREARTISTLSHPHVCALYDIAEHDGVAYLVMEHVEGETLDRVLAHRALSTDEVRTLATQIASALAAAHAHGIVHRDLKPSNVMVTPFGAKVLDFGLAKAAARFDPRSETTLAESALTKPGQVVGTPAYMSPEQARGELTDERSDLYAMGCLMFRMVTGETPCRGHTLAEVLLSHAQDPIPPLRSPYGPVPAEVQALSNRALAKHPGDRFASAGAMSAEIDGILAGLRNQEPVA